MTIANVGLMTASDKAKIREDVISYEKNQAEIEFMKSEMLEVSRLMSLAAQNRMASSEAKFKELETKKANLEAKIATREVKIASIDAKDAIAKHNLIMNAVAHAIGDHYKANKNVPSLSTDQEMAPARKDVEEYLLKYEQAKTPDLGEINMQDRCVKLLPGTTKLILEILRDFEHNVLNLTKFKADINPQAFQTLLTSGLVTSVLFVEKIRGTEIENKAKQAGLRIFFENNGKVTESKLASMAISTSTSSSSSPIVTKNSGNSPDNSPPKNLQVGKPLPVPPPKALPKPPAPRNQPLEAK